jgi:hypothetical protein
MVIPMIHRRLLPQEKWRWYGQDVGIPLTASLLTAGTGRLLVGRPALDYTSIGYLLIVSLATLVITSIATPTTRTWLLNRVYGAVRLNDN